MSTTGDMVIELNFVPEWARQPAAQSPYARFEDRHAGRDRGDRNRDHDQNRRRPDAKSGYSDQRRKGPAFGDKRRGGAAASRPMHSAPGSAPNDRRQPAYNATRNTAEGERPENRPPPIEVSFIPERRGLKPLVAKLARSGRAYPLFEVATIFLSKPEFYAVKLEVLPESSGSESVFLYQCSECRAVFLDRNRAVAHALNKHMDLFYAREETQIEPPKGTFICVARCKLSGELLGPPNYHEFNERVAELHGTRFASMSMEVYRRNIVNETDPTMIEQWKKTACSQTVYRTLRIAEPLTFKRRNQMEAHFLEHYAPTLIRQGRRFVTPGVVCRDLDDPAIHRIVEESWVHENRFPLKMAISIQPAFRHLGLHMFKASGKAIFVTSILPHPMDPRQATEIVRQILECLSAHPGVSRQELVTFLQPTATPSSPEVTAILHAIRWMVDKGHIIEFFNGTLSIPYRRPEPAKEVKPAG